MYAKPPWGEYTRERPPCIVPIVGESGVNTNRGHGRFEDLLHVEHCGVPMRFVGNYSYKPAGASFTSVGYECMKCFIHIVVAEGRPDLSPMMAGVLDAVE